MIIIIIIIIITLLAIKFKGGCLVNCNAGARNDVRLNLSSGPRFAKHFGVAFLGGKPFGACQGMDFQKTCGSIHSGKTFVLKSFLAHAGV